MSKEPLIAIIDDDAPFRVALVEALLSLEYEARGFTSAEEFILEDRQVACNCVITDIHMPGMSGLDLKLLLTSIGSAVPVIMITARTEIRPGGQGGRLRRRLFTAKAIRYRSAAEVFKKSAQGLIASNLLAANPYYALHHFRR